VAPPKIETGLLRGGEDYVRTTNRHRNMQITIVEEIGLVLRSRKTRRVLRAQICKPGEKFEVEFLGEDNDLNGIDLEFDNGLVAIGVPRHAVAIQTGA
jgi:hypothetical protein